MKNRILSVGIVLAVLLALVVGVSAQDISKLKYPPLNQLVVPDIVKKTLDNGMRLYILEDKSLPLVDVRVRMNCGSFLEPSDKLGLAGICGSVMRTGGTAKWTGDEIDQLLEGIGGMVETQIDVTAGTARVNVLSEYVDIGLEVLAEILRRPVFDDDKIELTKMQYRTSIARRNDEPGGIVQREFLKLIYGGDSPYARQPEYMTINAISRNDIVDYHQKYIHPENIQLAVWGDVDTDEIVAKLEQYFGDWPAGNTQIPRPPKVDYQYRSKVYYIDKPDVEQSYIRVGHLGGLATDPDNAARLVMSNILGESFTSRITSNVRSRLGLAYTTRAFYGYNFGYPGVFAAFASTKPQSTLLATREIIAQIGSMQTLPPTEEEMAQGKDGYLNSFVFNFDNRSEVIGRMMAYDFFGIPDDYLQQTKTGVEQVTADAVVQAAKNNLHPNEMIILVLGNAEQFDQPLESLGLGDVDTIDITIPSGEEKVELVVTEETRDKGLTLLKRVVEAHGGLEAFKNIKAVSLKGTISMMHAQGEMVLDFEAVDEYPNKRRSIISMMGQPFYDIRDGDIGWKTGQRGDVEPMTDEDLAENDRDLMRNIIYILHCADNPPFSVISAGTEVVDGNMAEIVALSDNSGESLCRLAVGPNGELLYKEQWAITQLGAGIIRETYSDWKEVGGINLPMTISRTLNGSEMGTTRITEALINPQLGADTFAKPQE